MLIGEIFFKIHTQCVYIKNIKFERNIKQGAKVSKAF